MNSQQLTEIWRNAGATMFEVFAQQVLWRGMSVLAIVDSVPFSAEQRSDGGGLLADFSGSIVFLKADYTDQAPKVGDLVKISGRTIRLATISGKEDAMDPTITFLYSPASM